SRLISVRHVAPLWPHRHHPTVFSAIGLALDLVGAVALVVGLFRPPRPLVPGYVHSPDDAARDAAFGVAGASLLALGFVFQSLPYFGLRWSESHGAAAAASAIALAAGVVYAYLAYGLTFLVVLKRKRRYGIETFG